MDTKIEYLAKLENDLERVAALEASRARRVVPAAPPTRGTNWKAVAGVAAALVALAFVVGKLATNGIGSQSSSPAAADGPALFAPSASPAPVTHMSGGPQGPDGVDLSKIVRDGSVSLVIADGSFGQTFRRAGSIATRLGGFVLSSTTKQEDSGTLTLRIPADRFDEAVTAVQALGDVETSELRGQDVTAEYIDLVARLKILRARRASLLDLLDRSTTLTTSLRLSDHLDEVELEIEQIQGRQRFLDDQVAESTLTVALRERNAPVADAQDRADPIENPSLGRAWARAVQGFFGVLSAVVVGLGYLLPIAVLAGLAFLITHGGFGRFSVRRRKSTSAR